MAQTISELENGVEVIQVTEHPGVKSNIYCEIPWCSSDSRFFVYQQQNGDAQNPAEFIRCEFGTWEAEPLAQGGGGLGLRIDQKGTFYYVHRTDSGSQQMMRVNLATDASDPFWEFPKEFKNRGRVVVSGDDRYPPTLIPISHLISNGLSSTPIVQAQRKYTLRVSRKR